MALLGTQGRARGFELWLLIHVIVYSLHVVLDLDTWRGSQTLRNLCGMEVDRRVDVAVRRWSRDDGNLADTANVNGGNEAKLLIYLQDLRVVHHTMLDTCLAGNV